MGDGIDVRVVAVTAQPPRTPAAMVVALLTYSLIAASNWPAVESLVCSDCPDAHELSRRLGHTGDGPASMGETDIQGSRR